MCKITAFDQLPKEALYKDFFSPQYNSIIKYCLKNNYLYETYWQGKYSESSCAFCDIKNSKNDDIKNTIKNVFRIKDSSFDSKYYQAISGDGQEYRRISILQSSSLVALLCFYKISPNHPLKIKIEENHNCIFTHSIFEYKNPIQKDDPNHCSNIDIVLVGKECDAPKKSVILFLESKFSEYLSGGKEKGISPVYDDIYNQITNNQKDESPIDGLRILKERDDTWSINSTIVGLHTTVKVLSK